MSIIEKTNIRHFRRKFLGIFVQIYRFVFLSLLTMYVVPTYNRLETRYINEEKEKAG